MDYDYSSDEESSDDDRPANYDISYFSSEEEMDDQDQDVSIYNIQNLS